MPYGSFFGAVVAATAAQFRKANGFANRFWGWGGEDDEFRMRYVCKHIFEEWQLSCLINIVAID